MRNEQNMRLKGQLKLYMRWPMIMSILLVAMNIWIYMVDTRSGIVMSVGVALYILIVGVLYLRNRTALFADLVQFADQYTDVQNILLKELSIPYAPGSDERSAGVVEQQLRAVDPGRVLRALSE